MEAPVSLAPAILSNTGTKGTDPALDPGRSTPLPRRARSFSSVPIILLFGMILSLTDSLMAAPSVSLTWNADTSSVAGYNVYRGAQTGGPYSKSNLSLVTGTAYTDTGVQAGQTYYYVATAVDSNDVESIYSNEAQVAVPYPPVASQLAFSPSSVAFGSVPSGGKSTQSVTLSNTGTATVVVSGDSLSGTSFSSSGVVVPLTLAGGQSTAFNVSFAPSAVGSFTGTLVAVSNASNSPTSLALSGTGTNPPPPPTTISYVQGNYANPHPSGTTVNVTFNAAQAAGDLNVVVVGWNDTTAAVSSVTDKSGNKYALAVGPTLYSSSTEPFSQSIYYAKNIAAAAAGANTVTVTFSTVAAYPDIRILEYSGADPNNPVDVTAASSGNSTTSSSGAVTTTNPTDLLFGANIVWTTTTGPGSGFTQRILTSPNGDIAEDEMVTAAGSYSATAPLSGPAGAWVMQMVAFRTPGAPAPNFSVTASPASVSAVPGNQGTSTITTTVSGGFNNAISLSAAGAPSGTTVSFNPSPIAAPGAGSSTMTITVGSSTATGTYPITVTGSGGGIQHSATVTLTVTAAPNFTLSASPTSLSVVQGNQGTSTITTTVSGGFNNAISLSAAGAPSGTTVSFNPSSIAAPGGGSSTMTITVGSSTAVGTYSITVTGKGGATQHNATITLKVVATIRYVQGNYANPHPSGTTVNVTFNAAQAAGDLNVVVVGWSDTTAAVSSVTDKSGNKYTLAVGPTSDSSSTEPNSQSIYYAKNIAAAAAGANTVTVTFSTAAAYPDIRILEYSGADPNNPVDVTAASSGNSTTSSSGAVTTTNPTDLLFGANIVWTTTTGPGSGFTQRILTSPNGDLAEDRMVAAKGTYSATAPLGGSAGSWVMQMVAFRTAVQK